VSALIVPVALFLGAATVVAFYSFLVVTRPAEAAERAKTAFSFVVDVSGGLARLPRRPGDVSRRFPGSAPG